MSGFYLEFGPFGDYDEDDEDPFEPFDPEDESVPMWLREPDPVYDLEGWLQEQTEEVGPVICAQAICGKCQTDGLHVALLFRWSKRQGKRVPVWIIDGADCEVCGGKGTLRARLVGPDAVA